MFYEKFQRNMFWLYARDKTICTCTKFQKENKKTRFKTAEEENAEHFELLLFLLKLLK